MKKLVMLAVLTAAISASAECLVKEGDRIAFMGDSITQFGDFPTGYVNLVMKGLEVAGVKAVKIPAGISGNKCTQMADRLKRDVLDKNPTWMTLSCGVNDVWHGKNGVPLDQYKVKITDILDRCKEAGVKVVILTPTMIFENPEGDLNKQLEPYNEWLREEAKKRGLPLADLNKLMRETLEKLPPSKGNRLTRDGVHMAFDGNVMMATGVLKAFGVDVEADKAKFMDAWETIPNSENMQYYLTVKELSKIEAERKPDEHVSETAARIILDGRAIEDKASRDKMDLTFMLTVPFSRREWLSLQK